jgi:hypothetical protein
MSLASPNDAGAAPSRAEASAIEPANSARPVRFAPLAWLFFAIALAQRLPFFLPSLANEAEYTDGILMIGRDVFGATFWPPLYAWACWALGPLVGGDLELAGKIVSTLSGSAAVVPLMWLAGEFGGAANGREKRRLWMLAGALYLASPIAWRWSLRVMSDSLFSLLFWSALAFLAAAWTRHREAGGGLGRWFVLANLFGVLSALTRHQGIFMAPLVAVVAGRELWRVVRPNGRAVGEGAGGPSGLTRRAGAAEWLALASLAFWLAWPLTQLGQATAHAGQVGFRAGLGAGGAEADFAAKASVALVALLNMTESFLFLAPYFFVPPIFLFALIGAIRRPAWRDGGKGLALASLFLAALFLGAQGVFQSFLSRYLLPLLPIVLIYAARGLAFAEDQWPKRAASAALLATLAWGALFGLASLVAQREAFGDLKRGATYLREFGAKAPAIYANETYKAESGMGAIKAAWWSGREVASLVDLLESGQAPAPGSLILVSSSYGGPEAYAAIQREMRERFGAELVFETEASLLPLLPDIMTSPQQGHQSPIAWVYRYQRQSFRTAVLRVP